MTFAGIPFAKLGGRKFVLAVLLILATAWLAKAAQFTDAVGLLFSVIYAGFAGADAHITGKAVTEGVAKDYGKVDPDGV